MYLYWNFLGLLIAPTGSFLGSPLMGSPLALSSLNLPWSCLGASLELTCMIHKSPLDSSLGLIWMFHWMRLPCSCAKREASMKVTSRSASRSFLLPTSTITMSGLASVRASVSQLVSAVYVSRLKKRARELSAEGQQRTEGCYDLQDV